MKQKLKCYFLLTLVNVVYGGPFSRFFYKVLDTIKFEQSSVLLRVNELFLLNLYSFLIFYILQSNLNLFKKKNIFPLSSKQGGSYCQKSYDTFWSQRVHQLKKKTFFSIVRCPPATFSLKIRLAMLQMTRFFKILHYHGPKFEIKF